MWLKIPKWKSKKYLAFVRTLPCCLEYAGNCDGPIQAHHIKGVGHLSETGAKAGDGYSMPICARHHHLFHQNMNTELWSASDQWEWIARTLNKAISQGFFNDPEFSYD